MTAKRYFALIGEDGYVYPVFFDSENEDKEIDVDTVVDLLNENEQLKIELEGLRKKYNGFSDLVDKRLQELNRGLLK